MPSDDPRLIRAAMAGPVFRLVDTVEVDVTFDDAVTTLRVELFQDVAREDQFRARTYESRRIRFRAENGEDDGDAAFVLVPWSIPGALVTDEPFVAPSREAALGHVFDDLTTFLAVNRVPAHDALPPVS